MDVETSARQFVKQALGDHAEFRPGQLEAIRALVEQSARVLIVQRTGWGKSVVDFIATRLLRDQGRGPTILISPLLSLMRDQARMANALAVRAVNIDSTNPSRWSEIERELSRDQVELLLVSPERLANERFQTQTLRAISREIGLFVVDEAHCISDWGHDFRPDYRRIRRITQALPAGSGRTPRAVHGRFHPSGLTANHLSGGFSWQDARKAVQRPEPCVVPVPIIDASPGAALIWRHRQAHVWCAIARRR